MGFVRAVSVAALWGVLAVSANAQSSSQFVGPFELPPEGFEGSQYIDSQGCAFIRVGSGARESWVPRVARNRVPVCGQTPSLAPSSAADAPAVAEAPTPAPPSEARPVSAWRIARSCRNLAPGTLISIRGNILRCGGEPTATATAVPPEQPQAETVVASPPQTRAPTRAPEGYQAAWEDGRLNPNRGLPDGSAISPDGEP